MLSQERLLKNDAFVPSVAIMAPGGKFVFTYLAKR